MTTQFDTNSNEVQTMNTYTRYVIEKMDARWYATERPFEKELLNIVNKNNGIIAGGFMTSVLMKQEQFANDLDIYVNLRNAQAMCVDICKFLSRRPNEQPAPTYDKSFMIRNNIMTRLYFGAYIDLLVVKNDTTLESVVDNFDLDVCKVWSDGKTIYTNNLDNINQRKATLSKDYVISLLEGNKFTMKRIRKYVKKGFTISYENVNTRNHQATKYRKNVTTSMDWFVTFILKQFEPYIEKVLWKNKSTMSFYIFALEILANNDNKIDGLRTILSSLIDISQSDDVSPEDVDNAIYTLIIKDTEIIDWPGSLNHETGQYVKKYLKYIKDVGIDLEENTGFNGELWDFDNFDNNDINHPLNTSIDIAKEVFTIQYPNLDFTFQLPNRNNRNRTVYTVEPDVEDEVDEFFQNNEDDIVLENVLVTTDDDTQIITADGGLQLPSRCFDQIQAGNVETYDHIQQNEGSILFFIEFGEQGQEPTMACLTLYELERALSDIDQSMYRCRNSVMYLAGTDIRVTDADDLVGQRIDYTLSGVDRKIMYVPITYGVVDVNAQKAYIRASDIHIILKLFKESEESRIVVKLKYIGDILHTSSVRVADDLYATQISVNHCQFGSNISVFKVLEINDETINSESDSESDSEDSLSNLDIDFLAISEQP